jgi:hypothetical protein
MQATTRAARYGDALAIGLITLVAYLLVYPGIFLGTETFFCRDYGSFSYPLAVYAKQSLLRGEVPLWNPYSLNGIPFAAQWSTMVFYPPTLLYLLFPVYQVLPLFMLLHLALGGAGMYLLLDRLTGSRAAALLAGFSFGFGGTALSLLCWPPVCAAYGCAPWVIFLLIRATEAPSPRSLALAAILGGMHLLTGMPELIAATWIVALTLALARIGANKVRTLLIILLLSAGLAALQLLPFLAMLLHSNRLESASLDWSLHPANLLNYVAPLFRTKPTSYGIRFPDDQKWLFSYYFPTVLTLGIAAMPLAAWKNKHLRVTAGLSLIGILLAMNPSLPGLSWLLACTPFGIVRYPIKFLFITALTLPLLAGFGIEYITNPITKKRRFVPVVLLATALLGMLTLIAETQVAWNYALRLLLGLAGLWWLLQLKRFLLKMSIALALLFLDVATHQPLLPTIPVEVFLADPVRAVLQNSLQIPKLGASRLQRMEVERIAPQYAADHLNRLRLLSRDRNLLHNVPSAGGFYPMYLAEQSKLTEQVYALENCTNLNCSSYLDFIGISIWKSSDGKLSPRQGASPMLSAGQTPIFVAEEQQVSATLSADLAHYVVLPARIAGRGITLDPDARIKAWNVKPHCITATVAATTNTVLVIAQSFYPAWKATVNSRPAELLRANGGFQAVALRPGLNQVCLFYQDDKFRVGTVVSAICAAVIAAMFIPREQGKT